MNKSSRPPISLLLLVIVPMAVVAWLGWRAMQNQQIMLQTQLKELAESTLQNHDHQLSLYFQQLQTKWQPLVTQTLNSNEHIRSHIRNDPDIHQLFILDPKGAHVYPKASTNQPLSAKEQAFLQRSATLWQNNEFLNTTYQTTEQATQTKSLTNSFSKRSVAQANDGWYAWFWSNQRRLVYWWKDQQNHTIGIELNPVRMYADIINLLPETMVDSAIAHHIRLLGPRGETLHQWGRYSPAKNEAARGTYPVSTPLHGWHFEYYSAALSGSRKMPFVLGIIALGIALLALALHLYREQQRHIQLARQRVDFVSQVSHELKTPLTNIRLYAELLEQQLDDRDTKLQRYSKVISEESQRLSRLIRNVLTFSREQSKRLDVHPQAGDVNALIETVAQNYQPALDNKGIELNLQLAPPKEALFDTDATEQIIGNLLSNIEKYGHPENTAGKAHIRTQHSNGQINIHIEDNGPGIPAKQQSHVFKAFYRISDHINDGVAGTGIGLSIARQLAERQGGALVLNEKPSELGGAHFILTLPLTS